MKNIIILFLLCFLCGSIFANVGYKYHGEKVKYEYSPKIKFEKSVDFSVVVPVYGTAPESIVINDNRAGYRINYIGLKLNTKALPLARKIYLFNKSIALK